MRSGPRYRVGSVLGTGVVAVGAVLVANGSVVQGAFSHVPYFGRPAPEVLSSTDLWLAVGTTLVVVLAAAWPLFKPRPRRILDTILLAQKRVFLAMIGLAALGYFNYSYRLPRSTLMVATLVLLVLLPAWLLLIRRRPGSPSRAVLVGDDPGTMDAILEASDVPVLGYVSPPASSVPAGERRAEAVSVADGGVLEEPFGDLQCLGGLSRLDEVFVKHDVDTALLAFDQADRAEFFGALHTCYDHGIDAKAHRKHLDYVLADPQPSGPLLDVELEPWDWPARAIKRLFDVAFAGSALLVLAPAIGLIALAIKLEGHGPVLFSQTRTYRFGDTFDIYKFRTLKPEEGGEVGTTIDGDRKTPLGEFLRRTHLDEIPQLWSILVGDMSVVGPRPAQTALETDFEAEANTWKQRWFVKPGLTGLAQINGATSQEPARKIEYDLEYVRNQSLWLDLKIVLQQIWHVVEDVHELFGTR